MAKDIMLNAINNQLRYNRESMYTNGKFNDTAHYYLTEKQTRLLKVYNDIFIMDNLDRYRTVIEGKSNDHIVEVDNLISFKKNYRG